MRVLSLKLEKVGPFDEAELEFVSDPEEKAPVTLLTGLNGTGKSIILDAIRGLFGPAYGVLERPIWRKDTPFRAEMTVRLDGQQITRVATKWHATSLTDRTGYSFGERSPGRHIRSDWDEVPSRIVEGKRRPSWVVDFWSSTLATDSHEIGMFHPPPYKDLFKDALQGRYSNASTTNYICYFDYLRSSGDAAERRLGDFMYAKVGELLTQSLLEGHFEHVARANFSPLVSQSGHVVPLANISSGNAYLAQRLMWVLWKMYAVHMLGGVELENMCGVPGLLLVDEAENHLHPVWQKRLLKTIQGFFPNLQIIAATHSPFILASAPNARVYVCRYDREQNTCVVSEESDSYANKPVDEILISSAFDGTQPFSEEMTKLIEARKRAIEEGNAGERSRLERILEDKNPHYFSYFRIDERLRALGGGAR